ncbi:MAG: bifunctional phosphoribosylaminoimidazolecarboxamide formyltransferase/IMP cyclohydrolase [Candidatus Kapaibacteriales bacterium]
MAHTIKPKTALISVSDKNGIKEFARKLSSLGVKIYSTGGTKKKLIENGVDARSVSELTGFPEIMDGRVKTLHPKVHGGILSDLSLDSHQEDMKNNDIENIDIVVVNLYPFKETLQAGGSHNELIEKIDIGGPTMVRASAKNYKHTCIVTDPNDYLNIISEIEQEGITYSTRERLASKAFLHTAEYDKTISKYFSDYLSSSQSNTNSEIPLRYGENPHQEAKLELNSDTDFTQIFNNLHGKELSYNNIIDIDASAALLTEFQNENKSVCTIIKHTNPCGVGVGESLINAFDKAFSADTVSPFGGIISVNKIIDLSFAEKIHSMFMEVIIAPQYSDEALELLTKKKDRRLIQIDIDKLSLSDNDLYKSVYGGKLVQKRDELMISKNDLKTVTKRKPTEEELEALLFNWKVCKHVKSNAIVYGNSSGTLAIGAGQMSRVDSSRIAVEKARTMNLSLQGSVVASDAFFPFADGLEFAAKAGATSVIQPGGSLRDAEVIEAADRLGLAMVFTGNRHFKH